MTENEFYEMYENGELEFVEIERVNFMHFQILQLDSMQLLFYLKKHAELRQTGRQESNVSSFLICSKNRYLMSDLIMHMNYFLLAVLLQKKFLPVNMI